MVRLSVVLILTAGLGGCGVLGSAPVAQPSLEQMVAPTAQTSARELSASSPPSALAMLPPEAGNIQKIAGRAFSDGTQQSIAYDHSVAGFKTNEVSITIVKPVSTARLDQPAGRPAPRDKPSEAAIHATLASDFPRMQMRIVGSPRSNDYGVYGLAAGQWSNGVRCIYTWQWIDPLKSADEGTLASVRIRLCRSDLTLDQLAALVDHLTIETAPRAIALPATAAESQVLPTPARKPQAAADATPARPAEKPRATPPALRRLATNAPAPFLALQAPTGSADSASEPDPSLPAAAYRGPSTNARTASQ
jgi:hypothetical protein